MITAEQLFLSQILSCQHFAWFHSFVVKGILAMCKLTPFSSLPFGLYHHAGSPITSYLTPPVFPCTLALKLHDTGTF